MQDAEGVPDHRSYSRLGRVCRNFNSAVCCRITRKRWAYPFGLTSPRADWSRSVLASRLTLAAVGSSERWKLRERSSGMSNSRTSGSCYLSCATCSDRSKRYPLSGHAGAALQERAGHGYDRALLMLLTGCRKSEALNATWTHFDLDRQIWTKPSAETKQRREHRVPYSSAVAKILKRRRTNATGPYFFPGSPDAPLQDVRRTWAAVCKATGPQSVRLHDLRAYLRQLGRIVWAIAHGRGRAARAFNTIDNEALR
jgi:Phage integrase family